MKQPKQILAKDCLCCVCNKQAVCWWPVIDPDIPEHPYCRKCVDEAKMRVIMKLGLMENPNYCKVHGWEEIVCNCESKD